MIPEIEQNEVVSSGERRKRGRHLDDTLGE
jgi:hypothetical protein